MYACLCCVCVCVCWWISLLLCLPHSVFLCVSFSSEKYTRFCQWKNLELNINVSVVLSVKLPAAVGHTSGSVHHCLSVSGRDVVISCLYLFRGDGGGVDPIPCVSTHRISDPRLGPAQLLPPHVKQRSYPHGVRPQIPDR